MIKIIGMCGRSGSGKGYVCKKFAEHGIPSIDTDLVYRTLTADASNTDNPCLAALAERFGAGVLREDKTLDRRALANIVFGDGGERALVDLNRITHKYILEKTDCDIKKLEEEGCRAVIIDAPLLFESGFDEKCDVIVAVVCSDETSVKRIVERDGISEQDALKRLKNQGSVEFLREHADIVIENELKAEGLSETVARVARELLA